MSLTITVQLEKISSAQRLDGDGAEVTALLLIFWQDAS
jgi:hypothetical protein